MLAFNWIPYLKADILAEYVKKKIQDDHQFFTPLSGSKKRPRLRFYCQMRKSGMGIGYYLS